MYVNAIVLVSTAFHTSRFVDTICGFDAACNVDPRHGTLRTYKYGVCRENQKHTHKSYFSVMKVAHEVIKKGKGNRKGKRKTTKQPTHLLNLFLRLHFLKS